MKLTSGLRYIVAVMTVIIVVAFQGKGQVAVKTNLLYDAALTPNLGVEIGLAPRWSLDLSGNYNSWTLDSGQRWKHWLAQSEARYWFCDRFAGHFLGFHTLGGQYNFGGWKHGFNFLGTHFEDMKWPLRHQGWFVGAGVAYGYTWILGTHWSMEAEVGLGWAYTRYDVYPCTTCGTRQGPRRTHNYVGPTKLALNICYVF